MTPAGDGHFTVTTQVRGGMTPWGEVKASSLKRADEYCKERGKQMHQVDMQTHGVRGWTPQEAELTFACVAGSQLAGVSRGAASRWSSHFCGIAFRGPNDAQNLRLDHLRSINTIA
ncbi:hypothetical protein PTKU64_48660 [Paraburkholderia terrae]|uniref:Uncharacterized protein n=1 Tax=Paraburkholderia terrae TaxID=311230 RepID=A0ABM7TRG3_9BURK|nr:hypothetical protein PTKU64_48660 [Paraburkholderia terrae]BDC40347.1 hypothetical protein PTKU15_36440 [Paraburkholderia terrae]